MPKISELTAIGTAADDDVLPVVDDTDDTTKKVLLSTLSTYVSGSSALDTAISDSVRQTDVSVAAGSVTLAYPSEVSVQVWRVTGANSSNTVTLPDTTELHFFLVWNDSATDTLDIVRSGSRSFQPSGSLSVTLAADTVGFYIQLFAGAFYITLN
jgi:hypothetical protein